MKNISIVIPHYNSWNKLTELLQTIPEKEDIEVIVVDDNSNEQDLNLRKISSDFPHVKFKKNAKNNRGAGAARNLGLSFVTGEWVIFADADDLFTDNFYNILENYFDSIHDIIYFAPTSFIDGTGEESNRHLFYKELVTHHINNSTETTELRLRLSFHVPWSKMVRRKLVVEKQVSFEEIMYSNDVLFSAKIGYFANSILASEEVIYSVRESSESLTSTMDNMKFKIRFDAWVDFVNFMYDNLSPHEIGLLRISALPQLLQVYKNKLGLKSLNYIFKESFKNKIPLVNMQQIIEKIRRVN